VAAPRANAKCRMTLTPALSHRMGVPAALAFMGRIGRMGLMACALIVPGMAQAPRVFWGKNDDDKVLAKFWAQNGNASNTVVGLNANHGQARFSEDLLPTIIGGRTLSRTYTGTNFVLQTWDDDAERFERFNFDIAA